MSGGALYLGAVMHRRLAPVGHRFVYRVFSLLVDLDRLEETAAGLRLFSLDRFNLFSLHRRDHGARDGSPLKPWVEARLADAGIAWDGGIVRLLCFPRVLGYVFNPLSLYFCHGRDGALRAMVYEVKNTFGEQHAYALPVPGGRVDHGCAKAFRVSPFIGMDARYRFRLRPPGERLAVTIRESGPGGPVLDASLTGSRAPLSDAMLARCFLRYPLMTAKVIVAIHFEAFRLWRKGVPVHRRPKPAEEGRGGAAAFRTRDAR